MVTGSLLSRFVSGYPRFWHWVSTVPSLRRWFNSLFINGITRSTPPRPYPLSLWGPGSEPTAPCADYVSWTGLVDRTYTGRHLPPASQAYVDSLPRPEDLRSLFQRQKLTPCPKSTALFAFFAQWFTDSFLRTDPTDNRKNTSNHEIDLCQIYGLNVAQTTVLRSHKGGFLRSELINGQEYPARVFGEDGHVKPEFIGLSYVDPATRDYYPGLLPDFANKLDRKISLFASGLERGNSTILYSAISTIFLREHNRLCREMSKHHPDRDDNRLFETARNTNIVELLKIIIQDYINHLSFAKFRMFVELALAEKQNWYRTNRICAEFDLLYRWHPLAPTDFTLHQDYPNEDFRYNNALLYKYGVEEVLHSASRQHAGKIMLHNTAPYLVDADVAALTKARAWRIAPYNDYRERFGLRRFESFEDLTGESKLASELEGIYKKIDKVEFTVGLLAESQASDTVLGELMMLMVGVDAFSQALTNPLLSSNVYGHACFSKAGFGSLEETNSFADVVRRNARLDGKRVSFDIAREA